MDTIIWLDGHTSKISTEKANNESYSIIYNGRNEFRLKLRNSEFVWKGNCWMQIKQPTAGDYR